MGTESRAQENKPPTIGLAKCSDYLQRPTHSPGFSTFLDPETPWYKSHRAKSQWEMQSE